MEEFIKEITKKAGDVVLEKFGKVGVKYTKDHATDVVTEADLLSNKMLTDAIKAKYPDHGIVSEEEGNYQIDSEYVWIIDPIDGTLNFANKIPLFGVIVALAKNKQIEMGAIYLPYFKEFYFAKRGGGSFLNGEKISCTNAKEFNGSQGATGANWRPRANYFRKNLIDFIEKDNSLWVNTYGSIAVSCAYVASGRRDWYVSPGGKVWDYAGGSIILEEAGCKVSDREGNSWTTDGKGLVAANIALYPKLFSLLENEQ